jgi:hypothetical protein
VVEHVVRRVAEQIQHGPFAEWLVFGAPAAHRVDKSIAMRRAMCLRSGRGIFEVSQCLDALREILALDDQDMADDRVAGSATAARARPKVR